MKEKIKSIIENLSNKYPKVEKKYKDTTYYVFNYYKYEQINKNYCIYFFPELTKEQAKEVFVPDFSPNQNDIISAGVGFIDSNELWICNFNPNEFKKVIKNTDKITGKYFTLLEKAFENKFSSASAVRLSFFILKGCCPKNSYSQHQCDIGNSLYLELLYLKKPRSKDLSQYPSGTGLFP